VDSNKRPSKEELRPLSELNPDIMFVNGVDLDCDFPYCEAFLIDNAGDEKPKYFAINPALAYYQKTHFCGSQTMCDNLIADGRRKVQNEIKEVLGINGSN